MQTYKVNTSANFSIGEKDFYLVAGETIDLPEHNFVKSLLRKKHISSIEKKSKSTENKTTLKPKEDVI